MNDRNNNPIIKKTLQFSLEIIEYCEKLDSVGKYVISNSCYVPLQVLVQMFTKLKILQAKMILFIK